MVPTSVAAQAGTRVPLSANQAGRVALATGPDRWVKPPCYFGLWISGTVDPELVAGTLTRIAQRHSSLRYAFSPDADQRSALCRPSADASWPLRLVDLADLPAERRQERLDVELAGLRQPFPLGAYPLTRAVLVRYASSTWLLGVAVDHIVFDGASVDPFLRDFEAIYRAGWAAGRPAGTDPGPAGLGEGSDFAAFAEREHAWLATTDGTAAVRHLRQSWPRSGPFVPVPLPAGSGREPDYRSWRCDIDAEQLSRARAALGVRRAVSQFGLLTGALVRAVADIGERTGWGVVIPFSRRVWPGTRRGIGYYNNRLYLPVPRDLGASVRDAVELMQHQLCRTLQHGMVPFELLLADGAAPLYHRKPPGTYMVVNVLNDPAPPALIGADTRFTWLDPDSRPRTAHGVTVNCRVRPDGFVHLNAVYDARRYDAAAMDEVLRRAGMALTGGAGAALDAGLDAGHGSVGG